MGQASERHPVFASLVSRDLAAMVDSVFGVVESKVVRLEVRGGTQWAICSVLVMFIDESLPEARLEFMRPRAQDTFRVVEGDCILFDLDGDDELIADCKWDLLERMLVECRRLCLRASSGHMVSLPRFTIKVFTLAGRLLTRVDMLFAASVRDLLRVVLEDCCCEGETFDCVVLPAFRQRGPALEDRFPRHQASFVTSSEVALGTLLMELGASVKVDFENVIIVYMMLKH